MWKTIQLHPFIAGCPNRCRHCSEEGGPPFKTSMSLDEVKWLVGEFQRVCRRTMKEKPQFRVDTECGEPTVHPEFLGLREYTMSFYPKSRWNDFDLLGTNCYGLARTVDWKYAFQSFQKAGIQGLGIAIHGLAEEHDAFVGRTGAYQDIVTATERALDCAIEIVFEIHLNKRNISSFASILDNLEEMASGRAKVHSGVPAYYMNERLRTFEPLRPTQSDKDGISNVLERAPDRGSDTEGSWTRQLAQDGRSAGLGLCTHEAGGKGPAERTLGQLKIAQSLDVTECFFSRPAVSHGNIQRDGIEFVWESVMETRLPLMPEPETLANSYGDLRSEALHPGADSVYMKLCDEYWRNRR